MTRLSLMAGVVVAGLTATAAIGDSHADKAALDAVKARKAVMTLYSFNLGPLGAMAKGEVEYDAEAATAAAGNLAKVASQNQARYWMPGTDMDTLGLDVTHARPAIWEDGSKAGEIGGQLAEAAAALEAAAGGGLDSLRGAIGAVGKTCGDCHETYREPYN